MILLDYLHVPYMAFDVTMSENLRLSHVKVFGEEMLTDFTAQCDKGSGLERFLEVTQH